MVAGSASRRLADADEGRPRARCDSWGSAARPVQPLAKILAIRGKVPGDIIEFEMESGAALDLQLKVLSRAARA